MFIYKYRIFTFQYLAYGTLLRYGIIYHVSE